MALRVKDVEIGGQKLRIGNLQLRPHRELQEGLDALAAGKVEAADGLRRVRELKVSVVLASLHRTDPSFTREKVEEFDGDDLDDLYVAVMTWTNERPGKEKPAGETPSP